MKTTSLASTIQALLTAGKGILAADESLPSIEKRFKNIHVPSTEENRRAYRELLFTTPELNEFISGVILFDETMRQKTKAGVLMSEALAKQGIVPGIKVDGGTVAFKDSKDEKITQGLDGLRERLQEYYKLGARFTKWRAVISIGENFPTRACIEANARILALFAAMSKETGIVPMVEPEVLMDGNHTIERCEEVTEMTLKSVFDALSQHHVEFGQIILKTGMVLPGKDCPKQTGAQEIAEATRRCLLRAVPAKVPGIAFLSGGQSEEMATQNLNAICKLDKAPWKLTFSFGRALQASALKAWQGSSGNRIKAQAALHYRAQQNSLAIQGKL